MSSHRCQPVSRPGNPIPYRLLAPLAALAALAALLGCAQPQPSRPPSNVLYIVSDAMRADALDCYGGAARTPNICSLATSGALFERAYANAPWTLPSSVSMFTGNSPTQYRRIVAGREGRPLPFYHIEGREQLLGEDLQAAGWRLRYRVENGVAKRSQPFQGFEQVPPDASSDPGFRKLLTKHGIPAGPEDLGVLWAAAALFQIDPAKPEFLLHWIDDPHAPYRPTAAAMAAAGVDPSGLPRDSGFYSRLAHTAESGRLDLRKQSLAPAEVAYIKRLYELEIESVDHRVGIILQALEKSGRAADTLVVFTADHGEEFGEHGGFLHDHAFYDEVVRVPLFLSGPGVEAGQRIKTVVSLVDLVPTLADLLGVTGYETRDGRSLRTALAGHKIDDRLHYLSSDILHNQDALVGERYKLIANTRDDGVMLFDLLLDPREQHDLALEQPEVVAEMRRAVQVIRTRNDLAWESRIAGEDPEERERLLAATEAELRTIGYLQ